MWVGYIFIAFLIVGAIILTLMKGKESFYKKPEDAPGYDD